MLILINPIASFERIASIENMDYWLLKNRSNISFGVLSLTKTTI